MLSHQARPRPSECTRCLQPRGGVTAGHIQAPAWPLPSGNRFPSISRTASHSWACLFSLNVATKPPTSRERRHGLPPGPPPAGWGGGQCPLGSCPDGGSWMSGLNQEVGIAPMKKTPPRAPRTQSQGCCFPRGVTIIGKTLLRAHPPLRDKMFTRGKHVKRFCFAFLQTCEPPTITVT